MDKFVPKRKAGEPVKKRPAKRAAAAKSAIYDRKAADTESGHLGSTPPVKPGRIERRNTARVMVRRDKTTGVVYYDPQSKCEKSSSMAIASPPRSRLRRRCLFFLPIVLRGACLEGW